MQKSYTHAVRVIVEVDSLETGEHGHLVIARGDMDVMCALEQYEVDTDRGTKLEEEAEVIDTTTVGWDKRTMEDRPSIGESVSDIVELIAVQMTERALLDIDADEWDDDEEEG
jgi:Pyruvate/2-oxoacid:ferredoxin oxidoreductase gamma subunit